MKVRRQTSNGEMEYVEWFGGCIGSSRGGCNESSPEDSSQHEGDLAIENLGEKLYLH